MFSETTLHSVIKGNTNLLAKTLICFSPYQQLSVIAKEVHVVLVNEIEGAHVPLLLVRSFMKAKAADWSAQVACLLTTRKVIVK